MWQGMIQAQHENEAAFTLQPAETPGEPPELGAGLVEGAAQAADLRQACEMAATYM